VVERRFRPWQFWLDRVTAGRCRMEICVSGAVARFQQERTGLPSKFFRVIENGIDLAQFHPDANPRTPGARVLSVGRLDPQKDYATLLKAWHTVERQARAAKLAIVGEGPGRPRLEAIVRSLGLKNVELPGFRGDIPDAMRAADVYVQSSAWEGFGLTVAEAMATALPTVVTDADSLPDLVQHDRTGLVVPKADPAAMAAAILTLLNDDDRARRLGDAARADALARFSVDRMVDAYAALYGEVLG
jgi:glycosyltransferase involved in cell wall biosynthesis